MDLHSDSSEDEVEVEVEETTKPASGECGTPGCDLADFHFGPCKTQLVIGPRQRQTVCVQIAETEAETGRADAAGEARRQAGAEGLTLQRSSNKAGYQGVSPSQRSGGPDRSGYWARITRAGKEVYFGTFSTAEEAALVVARANSRTAAPSPSPAVPSRPEAAKRAAPPPKPKPPRTKQARHATVARPQQAAPPPPALAVPAAAPAVTGQAVPPRMGVHQTVQATMPPPIGVRLAAVPASPAETLLQKVGRIKAVLQLDTTLSLVDAIKAANELMEITPAGAGLPSQAETLLATIGV